MIYLIAISLLFWPKHQEEYTKYALVLGGTFLIILILRYIQIKRLKIRNKWKKENER